eukprot:TRINITY_DN4105_c0_g1_i3.p2 TRINITY_DN4105_c0_g1~~TRINITY_DN4105_c0_g1_i3.p2  ORF type:complete len:235 (+),score=84.22 TRINITY_DN4105_c0_g1_i3:134-838(+)
MCIRDRALEYLVKIDGLSPLHLGRKMEIGEIHFMRGNVEEAARYFDEAVTLMHQMKQPDCVEVAEDYADKIFQADENAACPLLELCAKLARIYRMDLDWSVYNRLGMLLRRKMDWQGAVKAYIKAAEMAPENETILFNMGMAYVEGKDWGSAAQKFERAMRIAPDFYRENLPAAYIMGQVFIRASRTGNAAKILGYVNSVDPNYKKVRSLLDSLEKRPKQPRPIRGPAWPPSWP